MNNLCITMIMSLVGGILLLIGFVNWMRTRSFMAGAQQTKATVVRMAYSHGSGGASYAPVIQFKSTNGEKIEVLTKLYNYPARYKTGQEVDVLYDPQDPHKARINKGFDLYFTPVLLSGMGLIFFGTGIGLLFIKF